MFHGTKDVATAGTELPLTTARTMCARLTIQAKPGNTGNIYVGFGTVTSTSYGVVLTSGESLTLGMGETAGNSIDVSKVVIDSSVNGEGVTYLGEHI
jgi:hypothetical protein